MTNHVDAEAERLRSRLKWFLFFRVTVASFFLGALAFVYLGSAQHRYAVSLSILVFTIAVTYAVTIVSAVLLMRVNRLRLFAGVQLSFDIILTTGVIFITGGGDSPFGFLYSLVVINAAVLLSTRGAIAAAAGSSLAYATLVALLDGSLVARPDYPFHPPPPDLQLALRFATTNATFFLIALLAGSLVRRLHDAERLLEAREAEHDRLASLHEALARNIGSALITTDTDGRVISLNRTAEELAGVPSPDALGKDVGAVFAPLRLSGSGRLQFLQSSNGGVPTEFTHRGREGQEMTLRCSAVSVRDTYQNPIGALYILQDISMLRRLEQRLQSGTEDEIIAEDFTDGPEASPADGLIGCSPVIRELHGLIRKVAKTDATLLITGESGTGKEVAARAVHAHSARRDRPFVAVNCAAIPATLIESELFGHVRGAFTGAVAARHGLFRTADGGTIFLDEIGDLPLALQVKLLRVLQERSFTPVGADTRVTVDVRVIAATKHQLTAEVQAQRFREDLFYRLNVLTMELPPLRERRQDIPLLTRRFLRQFSELHGKHVQRLAVPVARQLQEYDYPGNVRELENVIEHAVALCDGETVHEQHLPDYVLNRFKVSVEATPFCATPTAMPPVPAGPSAENLDDNLAAYEKTILLRALSEAGGVKKRAAELLGINYRSFRHRLQKYGLSESAAP
ncbi:MAG: sigma-54 interaction domain-containing protein [Candidatus Binatia bacterium]